VSGRLEFFYDYGSPFSYIADTRLAGLRERTGCEIAYRPMLLGGVFKATGNHSPMVEPVEAKRRYFATEMQRWIDHCRVPFRPNPHFPINTLLLMRAAHAAIALGGFDVFHAAVYPAFWNESRDMGDARVVAEVLDRAGLPGAALLDAAGSDEAKNALRRTTDEAVERGVFGAPSFFVDGEMYFGNDRLDFVERALGAGAEEQG
jgi:2-hydroxychromene-2-carboxylate isomerase